MENGPFRLNEDGKTLSSNEFAWNKFANVLYLEHIVGVGFSYSTNNTTPLSDDEVMIARNSYNALLDFFETHPEYNDWDLYISGQSYSASHILLLAKQMVELKKLKGISIGNGVFNQNTESVAIDFMYFHGVIDEKLWKSIRSACCSKSCIGTCDLSGGSKSSQCSNLTKQTIEQLMIHLKNDEYNVYSDCDTSITKMIMQNKFGFSMNGNSTDSKFVCKPKKEHYLNQPQVKKSLNVRSEINDITWTVCNEKSEQTHGIKTNEIEDLLKYIIENSEIRLLVYNGDNDPVSNFLFADQFIRNIAEKCDPKLEVIEDRQHWWLKNSIAGRVTRYHRMDYLTIKGGGHFVADQSIYGEPILQMMANFVMNMQYSYSRLNENKHKVAIHHGIQSKSDLKLKRFNKPMKSWTIYFEIAAVTLAFFYFMRPSSRRLF